jgi:hypothetical protein
MHGASLLEFYNIAIPSCLIIDICGLEREQSTGASNPLILVEMRVAVGAVIGAGAPRSLSDFG